MHRDLMTSHVKSRVVGFPFAAARERVKTRERQRFRIHPCVVYNRRTRRAPPASEARFFFGRLSFCEKERRKPPVAQQAPRRWEAAKPALPRAIPRRR
jgi:hypothetical protein